jgi:hypothetical protein
MTPSHVKVISLLMLVERVRRGALMPSDIPFFEWPAKEKQFEAWEWNAKQRRISDYKREHQ